MTSNDSPEHGPPATPAAPGDRALDLERGLPTTPADVAALRRARAGASAQADMAAYLRFLAALPAPTAAELRARPGPAPGPPFRLFDDG